MTSGWYEERAVDSILKVVVPDDVLEYIRSVFDRANTAATATLSREAILWEERLDLSLVGSVSTSAGAVLLPSGALVTLEAQYLGERQMYHRHEAPCVGLIVGFRQNGVVVRSNAVLLRSARLYPNEIADLDEFGPFHFRINSAGILRYRHDEPPAINRTFHYDWDSKYLTLDSWIGRPYLLSAGRGLVRVPIPVHYLLYNPASLPSTAETPISPTHDARGGELGARVVKEEVMQKALKNVKWGEAPSIQRIAHAVGGSRFQNTGYRVEDYVADELVGCRDGHIYEGRPPDDAALFRIFYRRRAPITASIGIMIDMPDE